MIGTRPVAIHTDLLLKNLANNEDRARAAIKALVSAFATSQPSGKMNAFGNTAVADWMLVDLFNGQCCGNLMSAFTVPVTAEGNKSATRVAIERISDRRAKVLNAFDLKNAGSASLDVEYGEGRISELVDMAASAI